MIPFVEALSAARRHVAELNDEGFEFALNDLSLDDEGPYSLADCWFFEVDCIAWPDWYNPELPPPGEQSGDFVVMKANGEIREIVLPDDWAFDIYRQVEARRKRADN